MRKTLLILTAGALTFTACKKSSYPEVEPDDIYELPYNKDDVATNKAFVESEGRDFVKQVNGLPNEPAFDALKSLSDLDLPELELSATLNAVAKLGTSTKKIAAISGALSEAASLGSKIETYKLSNAFGIYKYNATKDTWDKTSSNDKIEFHFPSTKGGKSNDAVLAFTYKSSGKTFTQKDIEYDYVQNNGNWESHSTDVERIYELPASVLGTLTIGGKNALELTSTFDYHGDNLPKSALAKMTIGAYSAQTEINNDNKAATVKFTFAKNGQTLIAASGNSTFDNISYDKLTNDEVDPADFLLTTNTNIVVGDITMAGQIDFAKVNSIVKPLDKTEPRREDFQYKKEQPKYEDYNDLDAFKEAQSEYYRELSKADKLYKVAYEKHQKEYNTALAKALNENSVVAAVNTAKKEKIASLLFQATEDKYEYNSGTENEVSYYYDIEPLLVF
ncbi:MAG: hypothetical protein LBE37_14945, partial [Sphingobacterium sp.]|nr:hypothetical protein [Sphingobacterium sp.]